MSGEHPLDALRSERDANHEAIQAARREADRRKLIELRDKFAGDALAALININEKYGPEFGYIHADAIAQRAYQFADAMMKARGL